LNCGISMHLTKNCSLNHTANLSHQIKCF
jgi:hypothetical protein